MIGIWIIIVIVFFSLVGIAVAAQCIHMCVSASHEAKKRNERARKKGLRAGFHPHAKKLRKKEQELNEPAANCIKSSRGSLYDVETGIHLEPIEAHEGKMATEASVATMATGFSVADVYSVCDNEIGEMALPIYVAQVKSPKERTLDFQTETPVPGCEAPGWSFKMTKSSSRRASVVGSFTGKVEEVPDEDEIKTPALPVCEPPRKFVEVV